MKNLIKCLVFTFIGCVFCACPNPVPEPPIPDQIFEDDIADEIVGEWVYDSPEKDIWQSMKFVAEGSFFCYSDNKLNWAEKLKNINKGIFAVNGMNVSGDNGTTHLNMTVSVINGYQFTARYLESSVDLTFHKVVMRTHLNFGESVLPPYIELVDATIMAYNSHDESIASVDENTGEITALVNNGRTYVDIVTKSGTCVIKVMIGRVDDGDEAEVSPIEKKTVYPSSPIMNLEKAILGQWIYDVSYLESDEFLENGKFYSTVHDEARRQHWDNVQGDYSIDPNENTITTVFKPTPYLQNTSIWKVKSINRYHLTATFYLLNGDNVGTFTYAKKLGSIELVHGSSSSLDYSSFVEQGTIITNYQSHNPKVAEVNSENGVITAIKEGKTYIDVVTEDGIAVIEVIVK